MTVEERKRWDVTRSKGYNQFLLVPDWAGLLGAWIGTMLGFWQSKYGFSLGALKTDNFWAWAGAGLFGIYMVKCFVKMFIWRHKEMEYLSERGDKGSTPIHPGVDCSPVNSGVRRSRKL